MAILLDKLKQRSVGGTRGIQQSPIQQSPLPTLTADVSKPPTRELTTTPLSQRVQGLPQKGTIGSMPKFANVNKRFVADLPANVQIQGIEGILAGQDSQSPVINNFVRGMASRGSTAEEIRQAFINQQKNSADPLVIA